MYYYKSGENKKVMRGRDLYMSEHRENLLEKIKSKMPQFSKGQKLIAEFIINQYDKAAFITAARLGETVGVSESTVVRFASELGFEGYPGMQRALQSLIRSQLTAAQRVDVASERMGGSDILTTVLEWDMGNIRATLGEINRDEFEKIIKTILSAKNIYIMGARSSAFLAGFLSFYFNLMFDNVHLIQTSSTSEIFEQLFRIGKDDVIIGISFPRYSSRTLKSLYYAKDRHATVIGLTDTMTSPIAKVSDMCLIARSEMASFADSLVAPLSVINALIVAISMLKKQEILGIFDELERTWDEYQVYEKFDSKE